MRLVVDQPDEVEVVGAGVALGGATVAVGAVVRVGSGATGVGGSAVGAKVLQAKPKSNSRDNRRRIAIEIISHLLKSLNEPRLRAE